MCKNCLAKVSGPRNHKQSKSGFPPQKNGGEVRTRLKGGLVVNVGNLGGRGARLRWLDDGGREFDHDDGHVVSSHTILTSSCDRVEGKLARGARRVPRASDDFGDPGLVEDIPQAVRRQHNPRAVGDALLRDDLSIWYEGRCTVRVANRTRHEVGDASSAREHGLRTVLAARVLPARDVRPRGAVGQQVRFGGHVDPFPLGIVLDPMVNGEVCERLGVRLNQYGTGVTCPAALDIPCVRHRVVPDVDRGGSCAATNAAMFASELCVDRSEGFDDVGVVRYEAPQSLRRCQ
mmetsp:Transcript_83605/g.235909  ORF Transcript_83605/g.235909 Transcript_83605/m.235909 type:complete len:290 (+) Transcript_83605:202-1071(+)